MSPPIIDYNEIFHPTSMEFVTNGTALVGGVIVMTQGTRCDGIINCWNAIDERGCNLSNLDNFFIRKILHHTLNS